MAPMGQNAPERREAVESLRSAWTALDTRRRIIVALATIGMFAAIIALSRGMASQDMVLLYAGLDGAAAGEVVAALEQKGIPFEVRGDAIFVPEQARDVQRMTLAAEGLPSGGSQGYELLDSLSGFGTTAQMFDAAYWRAKEGELARTILSVPGIRSARVHISTPSNRPFQRDEKHTASVTVTTNGNGLTSQQAQAMRFVVSAAVSGLAPTDVAIVDAERGLVPDDDPGSITGMGDHSEELRGRAQRVLEARVGYGNAVVELTVEPVTDTESITERRIDPESRVAVSTDVEESTSTSQNDGGDNVTVASNLPDGDANGSQNTSSSEDSSTRSLTNFELSETSREVLRGPGAIRRLTVAVLVNDPVTTDAAGVTTSVSRSTDELESLRDLVASAVGFDDSRGDVITIKSMAFEIPTAQGTEAVNPGGLPLDVMTLAQLGLLALVAIALGLFVLRPILRQPKQMPALLPPEREQLSPPGAAIARPALGFDAIVDPDTTQAEIIDPVTRLRRLIEERQDETAQILQNWIEDTAEKERA